MSIRHSAIQAEDASIFADQQKGIQASPHAGCIGMREKRIDMFHRYLLQNVDLPLAPQATGSTEISMINDR